MRLQELGDCSLSMKGQSMTTGILCRIICELPLSFIKGAYQNNLVMGLYNCWILDCFLRTDKMKVIPWISIREGANV